MEDQEPVYVRGSYEQRRPMISTAANEELRSSLKRLGFGPTGIACDAVKLQLSLWEKELKKRAVPPSSELFGVDLARMNFIGILGEHLMDDVEVIYAAAEANESAAQEALSGRIWSWFKLPFTVRCAGRDFASRKESEKDTVRKGSDGAPRKRTKVEGHDELIDDVDEWVLRNEMFLRTLSKLAVKHLKAFDSWSFGLVRIQDLATTLSQSCSPVRAGDTTDALKISRVPVDAIPGYPMLHAKRAPSIYVQPDTTAFKSRFDMMTDNILADLDWDNIFVAGGLVLGALLTPDIPSSSPDAELVDKPSKWVSSDIDMYIYGLPLDKANEKIQHIADVYKKNLPKDAPFLVVRNSQTITLYSQWPRRRVQIVLKLVQHPREVLLNFDLDICAVGWDGKEVWMLPRFVRALETGMNVFTMDLVNGHYLGDRKATRDKRVFKYADRGYGIHIIPLYLSYLSSYKSPSDLPRLSRGQPLFSAPLSLPTLAKEARVWTEDIVDRYIKAGQKDLTFYWPHRFWPKVQSKSGKPIFSHAMLESYAQITSEPLGRSCLTGFSLLMRHVALWEIEIEGKIEIYHHIFAEDAYNNIGEVAYDDTPMYDWDENFSVAKFKDAIDQFNQKERVAMSENLDSLRWKIRQAYSKDLDSEKDLSGVCRVTYSTSVGEVLSSQKDIVISVITTRSFVNFANKLVEEGWTAAGLGLSKTEAKLSSPLLIIEPKSATHEQTGDAAQESDEPVMALWRLDKVLNWQMLDRRIDEIREALWAFHRANEREKYVEEEVSSDLLRTQISKRAIRISEDDEVHGFVRWVGRKPYHEDKKLNALIAMMSGEWSEGEFDDDDNEE